eukprot:9502001-Pyramimonas_sp.AAC.1
MEKVVVKRGNIGLSAQWECMRQHYPEGTYIVCMLDHVTDIRFVHYDQNGEEVVIMMPCGLLKALINHAGDLC